MNNTNNTELIVAHRPKSSIAEALKTIRTNLDFSSIDKEVKSILVTSSMLGEGKSFIAANLAVAYAQSGKKVLLVDSDLRRGRQNEIFYVQNSLGYSSLLMDDVDKSLTKYISKTSVDNLSILPRGMVPPNPSEMLESKKNKDLYEKLISKYDLVIYDGVPIIGIADSIIMANLVDKIVIVSAYKTTKTEQLEETIKLLDVFKEKIAGVVLNKTPEKKNGYYSYYE